MAGIRKLQRGNKLAASKLAVGCAKSQASQLSCKQATGSTPVSHQLGAAARFVGEVREGVRRVANDCPHRGWGVRAAAESGECQSVAAATEPKEGRDWPKIRVGPWRVRSVKQKECAMIYEE